MKYIAYLPRCLFLRRQVSSGEVFGQFRSKFSEHLRRCVIVGYLYSVP